MTTIEGHYYDGRSSRRRAATLEIWNDGRLIVRVDGDEVTAQVRDVTVSDRVADTPRWLVWPDGAKFETAENDAIDAALIRAGRRRGGAVVDALERRWMYLLPALVVLAGAAWWFVAVGLPALADRVARAVPPAVAQSISRGALDMLDRRLFRPSRLPPAVRRRLRGRFRRLARGASAPGTLALRFRRSPALGANAFALPSGEIVVTDDLVRLAEDDDEIVAVLAHEIGHVVHRHALRRALQSSALVVIIATITGDASHVAAVSGLPAFLVQMRYSRDFEREADAYAVTALRPTGVSPARLADILERMQAAGGGPELPFLTTHPATRERTARLRAAAPGPGVTPRPASVR